ncbi:MAG: hypothetical protein LKCHEGNO_03595 [Burkholderiaceae bacterium]|nr:hypothetical protein [Burkholderiaceae bacterium]
MSIDPRVAVAAARLDAKPNGAAQRASEADSEALFRIVDMAALAQGDDRPPTWLWDGYIPAGHVALLAGHGGAGKSTLALHLAACSAMGAECLGRPTRRARVLFFSGEDPASLVLARLRRICARLGFPLAEVQQQLQVIDATELEPVLFAERRLDGVRHGLTTPTYGALAEYVARERFGLVIVDNASDVFDADEINRALVRRFIRSLAQLVRGHDGAMLLLAHVDKLTSRNGKAAGGEAYSGSTAWHNTVRSRLFLLETEPGLLELQHLKANLGPKLPALRLEWPHDGVMQVAPAGGGFVAAIESRGHVRAVLKLLCEFHGRGEFISTADTGRSCASAKLSTQRGYPKGMEPRAVFNVLREAERAGYVRREQYKGADRKPRERFAPTLEGRALLT